MTYDIRLHAYEPGTDTSLGFLPDPLSLKVSFVHNNDGALEVTYSRLADGGALAARTLDQGLDVGVEVNWGAGWVEPPNGRFLLVERDVDPTDTALTVALTFVSWSWLLNKICDLNTGALAGPKSKYAGTRVFSATRDAGDVVKTMLDEHDARTGPAVPIIRSSWNTTHDSGGAAWLKKLGRNTDDRTFPAGQPLHQKLDAFVKSGLCDYRTVGRALKMYNQNAASVDVSTTVRLVHSDDLTDAPSKESQADRVARLLVKGEGKHKETVRDPSVPEFYGRWEALLDAAGVKDDDDLQDMGDAELDDRNRIKGEYTRTLTMAGKLLPFKDYSFGDWVKGPTSSGDAKLRVMQITLTRDEQSGIGGNVVLGDRFTAKDLALAGRVAAITGGTSGVSGNGTTPQTPPQDTRQPSAPTGLSILDTVYVTPFGEHAVRINASWSAVTTATDGTALEVSSYELWGQPQQTPTAAWRRITSSTSTAVAWEPFEVNSQWIFTVRALGTSTTEPGVQSAPVTITLGHDTVAPNQPSTPTVFPYLGTLVVGWDGKDNAAAAMPADFALCRVEVNDGSGWSVRDRFLGAGTVSLSGLEYGVSHQVRLVAMDLSGNSSTASATATGTPESAAHILAGEVDAGEVVRVGPATGNHTEMTAAGFYRHATDPSDSVVKPFMWLGDSSVGPDGLVFGFDPTNPLASIDSAGHAAFQSVSTDAFRIAGESLDDILARFPRGILAWTYQQSPVTGITSTETGVVELRANLEGYRHYEVQVSGMSAGSTVVGDVLQWQLRYATGGAAVTMSSTVGWIGYTVNQHAAAAQVIPKAAFQLLSDAVGGATELRVLLTCKRLSGTGTVTVAGSSLQSACLTIEDKGQGFATTTTQLARTSVWNCSAMYQNGAGSIVTSAIYSSTTGQFVNALFNSGAVSGETGSTVATVLSGASMVKAEVYLYAPSQFGYYKPILRTNTATTANPTPAGSTVTGASYSGPSGAWFDITSLWALASRSIHIHQSPPPFGGTQPGGVTNTAAHPLQLRLTYLR